MGLYSPPELGGLTRAAAVAASRVVPREGILSSLQQEYVVRPSQLQRGGRYQWPATPSRSLTGCTTRSRSDGTRSTWRTSAHRRGPPPSPDGRRRPIRSGADTRSPRRSIACSVVEGRRI